jgi:hypothetical protein
MAYQGRDYARFYDLDEDVQYPSVTTILDVINKPALGPWYAKVERQAILAAVGDALTGKKAKTLTRAKLLAFIEELAKEKKAADKLKDKAADIGNKAHAMVEWTLRKQLGLKVDQRPEMNKESTRCFQSWQKWFKGTGLAPLHAEKMVFCHGCGIAGTADLIAVKKGQVYVLDWKTGKAIYEESFLQNIAYQHCWRSMQNNSKPVSGGAVVRLPKEGGDVEVQMTPKSVKYESFQAAHKLWQWTREIKGMKTGDAPKERHA